MISQEIIAYIKTCISQRHSKEAIKQTLIQNGWQDADIEEAFNTIYRPANTNVNPVVSFQTSQPQISIVSKGVYSPISIAIGNLIGGPFVAGYLVGENEKEWGNIKKGNE